jgi:hypothetical protein
MVQPLLFQGVRQRPHDVLLPDQRIEAAGAVFTGEDLVGHKRGLPALVQTGILFYFAPVFADYRRIALIHPA